VEKKSKRVCEENSGIEEKVMPFPTCYTSSSIGPCPDLHKNFLDRPETVSITWDDGFHFEGDDSFFRVYHQCEPIDVLNVIDKLIANHKHYDLIMAFDERVLRECPNSVFLTESACSWLGRVSGNVTSHFSPENFPAVAHYVPDTSNKEFAVSFLTSSKNSFPGHRLRQEIFEKLPAFVGDLRVWKHRSPPRIDDKKSTVEPYMFSIVPENSQHAGYYTEKLVDCFVAKTIPLYWGCPDISKHFDASGILSFSNYEQLFSILEQLRPELYDSLQPAIQHNFETALKGVHQWDLIENYISAGIQKKHSEGNKRCDSSTPLQEQPYGRLYRPLRKSI
jgi:hypothetical protein